MMRKTKSVTTLILAVACSLAASGNALSQVKNAADEQRQHEDWLFNRISEADSIKAGTSKATLLKVFEEDGGLQSGGMSQRFVLRSCHLIKVDVKFELDDAPRGAAPNLTLDGAMKITEISKPYLEPMYMD